MTRCVCVWVRGWVCVYVWVRGWVGGWLCTGGVARVCFYLKKDRFWLLETISSFVVIISIVSRFRNQISILIKICNKLLMTSFSCTMERRTHTHTHQERKEDKDR